MKKLKVLTVVGTRPEIIRLSRVMAKLDEHTEHVIVHTGQNYDYELNEVFFQNLQVKKPKYFLDVAGKKVADTIGNIISNLNSENYIILDEYGSNHALKNFFNPPFSQNLTKPGSQCISQGLIMNDG